jgi:hypothetical protein
VVSAKPVRNIRAAGGLTCIDTSIRKEAIMTARPIQREHSDYETGARKYPASETSPSETDTHAGMPTANPFGLTQADDETSEKTRQSEGVNQPRQATPAPATEKFAGAGPAMAEHSKDAKAPKGGRKQGAYVKH